ncbi:MAG: DUF1036 domain-containing protein [Hyphomicrobiaceae bacterium]|nr:DUF1036 domain-containing protein [Hyphomicrobiaceae bacterium]
MSAKERVLAPFPFAWSIRAVPLSRALMIASLMCAAAAPAAAELKICNATSSRIGVSVGYKDDTGWATEGWWNVPAQTCETLLKGPVPSRFIYVHAIDYDVGGAWVGTNFMCTGDKVFAIRDVQDCEKRGYKRTGFFEVDTGEAKDWTIRLTDQDQAGGQAP